MEEKFLDDLRKFAGMLRYILTIPESKKYYEDRILFYKEKLVRTNDIEDMKHLVWCKERLEEFDNISNLLSQSKGDEVIINFDEELISLLRKRIMGEPISVSKK